MIRHDYALQPLAGYAGRPQASAPPAARSSAATVQAAAHQRDGQSVVPPAQQHHYAAYAASVSGLFLVACVAAALVELFRAGWLRHGAVLRMPRRGMAVRRAGYTATTPMANPATTHR